MRHNIILILALLAGTLAQTQQVKVVIHAFTDYGTHEDFARKAAAAFEKVINSEKFHQAVLQGDYLRTDGYSNDTLYSIIIRAHEKQGDGGQDAVVDLRVRTLRIDGNEAKWKNKCEIGSSSGTLGIDGNGDGITAICPQRLDMWAGENNIAELAGHYAHEYMHILGFGHYKFLSSQSWRDKTFVYKIGYLVRDLIKADPTLTSL